MSQFYACEACESGWQIAGELEEVKGISAILQSESSSFPCITPLCSGRLLAASGPPQGFTMKELPVRAFYRAVHGFGAGEGDPATWQEFVDLIKNGKVVAVDATPIGQPERVILHELVFEDGTRMHFDSSSRGACCYYIERPGKTCVEVVEDELRNSDSADEQADGLSDSDREEAGRASAPEQPEADSGGEGLRSSPAPQQPWAVPVSVVPTSSSVREGNRSGGGWSDL